MGGITFSCEDYQDPINQDSGGLVLRKILRATPKSDEDEDEDKEQEDDETFDSCEGK